MKTSLYVMLMGMILNTSCHSLRSTYRKEVEREKNLCKGFAVDTITEEKLAGFPLPVQKYLRHCGWIGRPVPCNAEIFWGEVQFKMQRHKDWMPIHCLQFNSVPEPARFAYLSAPRFGINMFVGRDKYQNGEGNMHIKILGLFTLQNAKGRAMNESALVTILAESFFVPGYIFQPYIRWEGIDSSSVKAVITWKGITTGGIFYFNDSGEMIRFESDDRNQILNDGSTKRVHWLTRVMNYTEERGILRPLCVEAEWQDEEGDYTYWKGNISEITFNF